MLKYIISLSPLGSRYHSLSAYMGDDDMFSSDLSEDQLRQRLGHMSSTPCQVCLIKDYVLYWTTTYDKNLGIWWSVLVNLFQRSNLMQWLYYYKLFLISIYLVNLISRKLSLNLGFKSKHYPAPRLYPSSHFSHGFGESILGWIVVSKRIEQ